MNKKQLSGKQIDKQRGFTLIEVMIVVAIIAILATIAIPSYRRYVLEVNRKAAIAEMNDIGQQMERGYTNNNGAYQAYNSTTIKGYGIAVALTDNNQTYTITATPDTSQAADHCGTLSINNEGTRESNGHADPDCFK